MPALRHGAPSVGLQNTEMRPGLTFWTPNINIFRDPRWGRGQETYGEDLFPGKTTVSATSTAATLTVGAASNP